MEAYQYEYGRVQEARPSATAISRPSKVKVKVTRPQIASRELPAVTLPIVSHVASFSLFVLRFFCES
jgi:hypothetical protein